MRVCFWFGLVQGRYALNLFISLVMPYSGRDTYEPQGLGAVHSKVSVIPWIFVYQNQKSKQSQFTI